MKVNHIMALYKVNGSADSNSKSALPNILQLFKVNILFTENLDLPRTSIYRASFLSPDIYLDMSYFMQKMLFNRAHIRRLTGQVTNQQHVSLDLPCSSIYRAHFIPPTSPVNQIFHFI